MTGQPNPEYETLTLAHAVRRAVQFLEQQRLAEAEHFCREILAAMPGQFNALHILGAIMLHQQQNKGAVDFIEAALRAKPDSAEALSNLGVGLARLDRHDEAVINCDRALTIDPNSAAALTNRGLALGGLKRHDEALASYEKALALRPDYAEAINNRGNAMYELKRYEEALASYEKALAIKPSYAEALCNRGKALHEFKRHEEALASYDKALVIKPSYAEAFNNRGNALNELKRHQEALASFDRALTIKPEYPEAFNNRGYTLKELKRREEALANYDKALAGQPTLTETFFNRGNALQMLNFVDEAVASHEKALAIKPDYAEAKFALCMAQLPVLYTDESEIAERRAAYEKYLRALCDEVDRPRLLYDLAKGVGANQPFYLAYQGYNDRDLQGIYGSLVSRIMAEHYPPAVLAQPPEPGEPVRLGIVSGFFWQHSNWKIPIKGWLSQLDRRQFQLFGYHTGTELDAETQTAAVLCHRFVQGPLSLDLWRQAILGDAPHVLIYPEVGMDPIAAQLAAQRLAPVQCNSWGHPDTSGFPTLDYYLSSELMEPPDGQNHYTERLVRLPNLSIYYESLDIQPISLNRAELGLRSTAVVYWCGQMLVKYLPQFDQVFPRIAREVGNCQFVFIQYHKGTHVTEMFRKRLDQAFAAYNLRAADHCIFVPHLQPREFISSIGQCDIVLDSIGWSGCNSTLESLLHNLPIVTMIGALMRGRHTMAILKMMGVTETITETVDDYVSIAVRLARDESLRMAVKDKIAKNKHLVYCDSACISGLEKFLNHVARARLPAANRNHVPLAAFGSQ